MDSAFEQEIIEDHLALVEDPEALKDWLIKEMSYQKNLVAFAEADGSRGVGKQSKTGARADTLLLYNDPSKAKEIAKKLGSSSFFDKKVGYVCCEDRTKKNAF